MIPIISEEAVSIILYCTEKIKQYRHRLYLLNVLRRFTRACKNKHSRRFIHRPSNNLRLFMNNAFVKKIGQRTMLKKVLRKETYRFIHTTVVLAYGFDFIQYLHSIKKG